MLVHSVDMPRPVLPQYSVSLDTANDAFDSRLDGDWNKLYYVQKPNAIGYSVRQAMIDDIAAFRSLHDGWLGIGSQKIPEETANKLDAVTHLLEQLEGLPNPELTPNANGTISLEWESDRGAVYVEFGKTRISGFLRIEDSPTKYFRDISSLPLSFYTAIRDLLYPSAQSYSVTFAGATFDSYALR
jgi:hypothetical protein